MNKKVECVAFSKDGYKYLDSTDNPLFSDDNLHTLLFDYADEDISAIPGLLIEHFTERMNLDTFEILEGNHSEEKLDQIREILKSAHPYYGPDQTAETIITEIKDYFLHLVIESIFEKEKMSYEVIDENWYKSRLLALMPKSIHSYEPSGIDSFYKEYLEKIGSWDNEHDDDNEVTVYTNVSFFKAFKTQEEILNLLYFILDIDADCLKELPALQRAWIYGTIHPRQTKITETIDYRRISLDFIKNNEQLQLNYDVISKLMHLNASDIIRNGISEDAREQFKTIIDVSRQVPSAQEFSIYTVDSIYDLLFIEINEMIKNGCRIRRCKNCGRYFVVKNARYIYCNRLVDSERTCRDVGASITYKKHKEEDETLELYGRAYAAHYARYQKSESNKPGSRKKVTKVMTWDEFFEWAEEAQKMRAKVLNGDLSMEEYKAWLKE